MRIHLLRSLHLHLFTRWLESSAADTLHQASLFPHSFLSQVSADANPLLQQGQYQHTAPHADSHGVVGTDEVIQGAKLEPLEGQGHQATQKSEGVDDESVDTARIEPVGSVREEIG